MTDIGDDQLNERVAGLLSAAVSILTEDDLAERTAWCQEHNAHGIRLHLTDEDDVLRFDWGGKSLLLIRRDTLLSNDPIRIEYIDGNAPDTIEGLT